MKDEERTDSELNAILDRELNVFAENWVRDGGDLDMFDFIVPKIRLKIREKTKEEWEVDNWPILKKMTE